MLAVMRVGFGYDVHRFSDDSDRPLVLGGVTFPGEIGLDGHSDADVVLHAIIDALLGAASLGDIGDHFPPSDERWRNADSRDLARDAADLLTGKYVIRNVDVSVVAERPRIAARRMDMRRAIADSLSVTVEQVSVKATTNEGLGAIGRSEGIAAHAVALIEEV